MARRFLKNIAWPLLLIGVGLIVFNLRLEGLICCFFGAFMRLVYNSEKYKYFKFLHLELLRECGPSTIQKEALSACLWGFYRSVVDFLIVIIIPFIVIPQLDFAWWGNMIIAIVYFQMLKPIFKGLDDVDKEAIIRQINIDIEKLNRRFSYRW
ncbi:MAG: hypothetical protein HDS77_07025 [Bacteroidales bacterium]|nr:hypothetical protein [Bacteroidales bacterium]